VLYRAEAGVPKTIGVAGSRKRETRKTSPSPEHAEEPAIQMIVRRGANPRFEALTQKTKELKVEVMWDRRKAERRSDAAKVESDRRREDRRRTPPYTWDVADFVVVVPKPESDEPGE
jgi:hypothetical protein